MIAGASPRRKLGEKSERKGRDLGEIRPAREGLEMPASGRPGYRRSEVSTSSKVVGLSYLTRPGRTNNYETSDNHELPARNPRSRPFPSGWCPAGGTHSRRCVAAIRARRLGKDSREGALRGGGRGEGPAVVDACAIPLPPRRGRRGRCRRFRGAEVQLRRPTCGRARRDPFRGHCLGRQARRLGGLIHHSGQDPGQLKIRHVLRASIAEGLVPSKRTWITGARRREGICPRCGAGLRRETVVGRTTYWCPSYGAPDTACPRQISPAGINSVV